MKIKNKKLNDALSVISSLRSRLESEEQRVQRIFGELKKETKEKKKYKDLARFFVEILIADKGQDWVEKAIEDKCDLEEIE